MMHRRKVGELVISECRRSVIHGSLVAFAAEKQNKKQIKAVATSKRSLSS